MFFTPFLKSISLFSKRFFSENSVLMYGQYSRAGYNVERTICNLDLSLFDMLNNFCVCISDVIIEKSSFPNSKICLIIGFSLRQDLKSCDLFFAQRPERTETLLPRTSNLRTFVRQSARTKKLLTFSCSLNQSKHNSKMLSCLSFQKDKRILINEIR